MEEAENLQGAHALDALELPPGQVKLLATLPDSSPIAVLVPLEATLPLLRALRRTLEAVEVGQGNASNASWSRLFEGFGAGGSDLAGGECKSCGVDGEALRVRLAAAEARLAAATRHQQLHEIREEENSESPRSPPMKARSLELPTGEAMQKRSAEDMSPVSPVSPPRHFSLSAELWRLREALAKANGSKEKVSDMEVQRLQKALEKSHQKLQHYEESKEADYFPQEPDTARTHVAQEEEHRIPTASPGVGLRPSRSEYAQGVQGTVVKVVPRTPVSIVSRVSAVSPSPVRLGSPARARKTLDISTPPARPVQWSPHPYRGRLTDAPRVESRLQEAPPSAMTMAVTAMAQTAAMATRPPVQSPPRPARQWPRGSSVAKPATGQVIKSGAVSVSVAAGRSPPTPAPGKRVTTTWTTPRVAPPPLSSVGTVQMPPAQAPRAGSLSAPPVLLLPEALSPQRPRMSAAPSVVEIRTKVTQVTAKDFRLMTDRSSPQVRAI